METNPRNNPSAAGPDVPAGSEKNASALSGYRTGPKISEDALQRMQSLEREEASGATWRGWLIGLIAVAAVSAVIPYADFVMQASELSGNAFPMISVVLLLGLILAMNLTVRIFGAKLGLTRQDLTLVFCMTVITYAIPGIGFWTFWSTSMTAGQYHARPENRWADLLHPHMYLESWEKKQAKAIAKGQDISKEERPTDGLFVRDPDDPNDPGPRPVRWFYTGLPPGASIPWGAWAGPYLRWCLAVFLMYGIWFSISAILLRRWADQERLPFPVAQVPEEMLEGVGAPEGPRKGFLSHKLALWGMLFTFLLQSWNALSSYVPNLPQLPLINWGWNWNQKFFSEPPWNHLGIVHINIYPSIIGLTFLLSLEVAFSLWFFYFIMKFLNFCFAGVFGLKLMEQAYISQGTGALLALVLTGLWAARSELGRSFLEALGKRPEEESDRGDVSPRWTWLLLIVSVIGSVAWLRWAGVGVQWGLPMVFLFIIVMTGLARLIAEAGVFATQLMHFPIHLLSMTVTPAVLGSKSIVMLTVWDRIFTADWFRIVPLPNIMNCLQLSRTTGLRTRTALGGMAVGVVLAFAVSFFSFLGWTYTHGGANGFGWFFQRYPSQEYSRIANQVSRVERWRKKKQQAAETGKRIPPEEVPREARRDWFQIGWTAFGILTMVGFMVARRYLFWWPHPAGYVLWMASTINRLWLSFFLGWMCKWLISKFGGRRIYTASRKFFIGMIVGEALAAVFWVLLSLLTGIQPNYIIILG